MRVNKTSTPPLWIERLQKSLQNSKDLPESRFIQVATCDPDGFPQNRTLVFRYVDTASGILSVISDLRTSKIDELNANPRAGICWYFTQSREQFRFQAMTHIVTHEAQPETLRKAWEELSTQGKKQFLWGTPKAARQDNKPLRSLGDIKAVPAHFCKLDFVIEAVDYLNLKANPQYRELHRKTNNGWEVDAVIP